MSTAITFEEIEHNTERAIGFAALLKAGAWTMVAQPFYVSQISHALQSLVQELTPEFLESLNAEEADKLKQLLQPAHAKLLQVFKVSPALYKRTADLTEDLYDAIEALVLRENEDFGRLMEECGNLSVKTA